MCQCGGGLVLQIETATFPYNRPSAAAIKDLTYLPAVDQALPLDGLQPSPRYTGFNRVA